MMKTSKRVGRWLFPLLLLGAAAASAAHFMPRPRGLLERATRVTALPTPPHVPPGLAALFMRCFWLSDHELLLYKITPSRTGLNCNLVRHDVRTGIELPLTAIMNRVNKPFQFSYLLSVSPDGKHMLWQTNGAPEPGGLVLDMDGSHAVHWNWNEDQFYALSPDAAAWQSDSRHLVQLGYGENNLTPSQVYIRDIDAPKKVQKIPLVAVPEFSLMQTSSPVPPEATPDGRLFACSIAPNGASSTLISVPFGKQAVVRRIRVAAPPDTAFFQSQSRYTPFGQINDRNDLSPRGDRIVWLCQTQPYVPGFRAFLHRLLPKVKATPVQRMSLWVSRADGSGMHEVGGMEVDPNASAGAGRARVLPTPFQIPQINSIQWLPDGKQLSFMYRDALWTVPAD